MLSLERCKTSSKSLKENSNETSEPEIIIPTAYLMITTKLLQRAPVICGIQFVLHNVIK